MNSLLIKVYTLWFPLISTFFQLHPSVLENQTLKVNNTCSYIVMGSQLSVHSFNIPKA